MGQSRTGGVGGHLRGRFAGRGDPPLVNSGALHDPFVGGVDLEREIGIGENLAGQIAAAAKNDRTAYRHEAAPLSAGVSPLPGRAKRRRDLGQKLVAHHVVAEFDSGGEAFGIGAAVTLDDDAVEAEKHPAVGAAWVQPLAQLAKARAREQITDAGAERALHRGAQILADLAGGAFGGLERDVAGETLGDDDVDLAVADVVAFDEADIVEIGHLPFAQNAAGLADRLETFDFLNADIEKADGRPLEPEQDARGSRAHDREIHQMLGVRSDRGADIEHDQFAAQGRPQRRDRRPFDAGQHFQIELRHRHQSAGIARRYRHVGLSFLHRIDRQPHRGFAPAVAQCLARLVFHAHGDFGMHHPRGRLQRRILGHKRLDLRAVAEEQERRVRDGAPAPVRRRRLPRQGHGLLPSHQEQCGPVATLPDRNPRP